MKISVILPCYNAGAYLSACLDSLLAQGMRDFEVIFVDDGSRDDSLALARRYAERDARIHVFSQENQGVSAARNLGLARARGEWITFVDGDDLLPPDGFETLLSGAAEDGTLYFARQLTLSSPAENVNVPVLMYHAVSDDLWGYWDLFVSPQTIEEELLYLQENGFETIWFEDLSHIEDYEKPVILTFDDGYDDNYTELFPLLQKYNAKATIFVIPKAIGTPHKMTAEQIYELSQSGLVSIQSHTYSHGNLSTMDEETLVFEMEESQKYLAALTGQVPYAVCYPEGTRSELSIEVAGRYYEYGLLMNGQLYNTSDDPLRVKRFYVPRGYDLGSFRWSVQEAGTSRNW